MADDPQKPPTPPDKPANPPELTIGQIQKQVADRELKFQPSAAKECADGCNVMIGMLLAIKNEISKKAATLPQLGSMDSGFFLTKAFNDKAENLVKILESHVALLTAMGEAFRDAGRAYGDADGKSADTMKYLDGMKITKDPAPNVVYTPQKYKPPSDSVPKHDSNNGSETITFATETPSAQEWNKLYKLGQELGGTPSKAQLAAEAGGAWKWGHETITASVTELDKHLVTAKADKWEGPGATAAASAVSKYSVTVNNLAEGMKIMAANLKYTSEWLHTTRLSMPTKPYPDPPKEKYVHWNNSNRPGDHEGRGDGVYIVDEARKLPGYQENFKVHYADGIDNSKKEFVSLVAPPAIGGGGNKDDNKPGDSKNGDNDIDVDKSGGDEKPDLSDLLKTLFPDGGGDIGGGSGVPDVDVPPPPNVDVPPPPNVDIPSPSSADVPMPSGAGVPPPPSLDIPPPTIGGPMPDVDIPPPPSARSGPLPEYTPPVSSPSVPGLPTIGGPSSRDGAPGSGNGPGSEAKDAASQAANAASQAAQAQAAERMRAADAAAKADQAAKAMAGLPGVPRLDGTSGSGGPGGPGSRAGAIGGGPGAGPSAPGASQSSKLFPRVALPGAAAGLPVGAGAAGPGMSGAGAGMPPGAPGAGAPGAANQGKGEHKRAKYLDSKEHLEEGFGPLPPAMKPVIEPSP
ncbi:hypothetical protein [Nocardia sp. NPDC052566]|uniref:hypothetical protein n=1 Tax=Nocardia sp. NPDC052566 TaxID=3364330 RepID=UPI0037CA5904